MKNLILLAIVFLFGSIVGNAYGFDATLSGCALAAASMIPRGETSSILRVDIPDLSVVVLEVQRYFQHATGIWSGVKKEISFEAYMRKIKNINATYVGTSFKAGEFLQAFKPGFHEKGSGQFKPELTASFYMKLDVLINNFHSFWNTYLVYLEDEEKTASQKPFTPWYVQNHVLPGIIDDLNKISVKGVYVDPTLPATPNATPTIASADGILTIIQKRITATKLVPTVLTGVITQANTYDKVRAFDKGLPTWARGTKGPIFCSTTILEDYKDGYVANHGTQTDYKGPDNTAQIYGTGRYLVGIPEFGASQRLLFDMPGNMICTYDKTYLPTKVNAQEFNRDVKLMAELHRGYGFETLETVCVNDQA